jgi:hypothetical protein
VAYKAIECYGVIGDMRTAAPVGTNGSIDWFCYPTSTRPACSPKARSLCALACTDAATRKSLVPARAIHIEEYARSRVLALGRLSD